MKRIILCLYVILLPSFLLSGCANTQTAVITPSLTTAIQTTALPATPTIASSATATQLPTLTPTIDVTAQIPHYKITASFDYAAHTLSVQEQVDFTNTSSEAYKDLELDVEPNIYTNVFSLESISLDGKAVASYTLTKNHLTLPLEQPLSIGASSSLSFTYALILPEIPDETAASSETVKPQVFGYSDRQTNLVDWYLYFPPYQAGQGWDIHDPSYYGEYQTYPLADFDVTITPVNPPLSLRIAAPALAQMDNGAYHYDFEKARTFVWSASTEYVVKTATAGSVTIYSYTFAVNNAAAAMALQNTTDAVALYSNLFGPYQHTILTMVEADFLDGMEYDGLYFLSKGFYNLYDGTPKGYLTIIAAHETAHQWWFAQVGNDQAMEPWLDEAMATFSERLFFENVYPNLLSWWQAYRVDYYQPTGYINQSVYSYNGYLNYRNAVYLRGEQFLEALRMQMGDEAFFSFLKGYAVAEQGKISSTNDFFSILANDTNQDISQLKASYFK